MCDLACKTKIIINGDNAAKALETLCEQVEWARDRELDLPHGNKLIEILNRIEDDTFKAQRLLLEDLGFTGPWPKALS